MFVVVLKKMVTFIAFEIDGTKYSPSSYFSDFTLHAWKPNFDKISSHSKVSIKWFRLIFKDNPHVLSIKTHLNQVFQSKNRGSIFLFL